MSCSKTCKGSFLYFREGFLTSVAKSLKKVGREHLGPTSAEIENLEDSMRKVNTILLS